MALLSWKDNFSVNIKQIDEQHKKLIDMLNNLHSAMSLGQGSKILKNILDEMAAYTLEHFKTEEELFEKYSYPETAKHKAEHDAFVNKVLDFSKQVESGKMFITLEVSTFLRDWLSNHILKSDMQYKEYFNSKGVQ